MGDRRSSPGKRSIELSDSSRFRHLQLCRFTQSAGGVPVIHTDICDVSTPEEVAAYSASKWAVFGLTEALRAEARALGKDVRYSSVHPMFLKSGMFAGADLNVFGKILFPNVNGHDQIARAIVIDALKRGARCPKRPRTLRLIPLLRGLLPDSAFNALGRLMGLHTSMRSWTGRPHNTRKAIAPSTATTAASQKEPQNE